ncbi:hypothetical protein FIV42_05660 [Persicimonas caeni]|uniref:P/Homo B domain-containing protein n=1 Tax=Persicimonas caeni TaxID=2292766 RepID=A0A4Y6PPU2_PERCE|nr:proprotein convertase P-domain-containing protein [Persicimonas caeni]QDG50233.1 hypothetical protein FIV42_05660 [Persicimonas caeni]QED31454.1 hypothetical protein FRD00_05655 [Persicimonas caeni]
MSKLRLILLTGLLAAAVAPLYGCGSECGPGTTEKDGQCVLVAEGCGAGTVLENKQCVVTEDGCGEGLVLEQGICVPTDANCAEGTTFDAASRTCIPNSEIVCGEGTEPNSEGTCVPSADACGPKTTLGDNGRCVVEGAACTAGSELDPNTGECLLVDEACGDGLALDGDTSTCVPTDEVCDTGTAFDSDSGLCLPDACEEGDVLIDGVCMNDAEELAAGADVVEQENNDPALGGTAETMTLPAPDADPYVFAGTISAPSDIDGDGEVDQDVDAFEFSASAGDWVDVMVQSTGLPAPAFVVTGPDGYVRQSALGTSSDAARTLVIPTDGTYTVTVLPSLVLASDYEVSRGGDTWNYVGSLASVTAPSATDKDASSGSADLTGELSNLKDNFFSVTNLGANDLVTLEANAIGEDGEAIVQIWADATTLHHSQMIRPGEPVVTGVPSTGDMFVVVDWTGIDGPQDDFDITANVSGVQNSQTITAGGAYTETVSIDQFDRLVITQSNPASADLDVSIVDPSGTEVATATLASGASVEHVAYASGDYDVVFTNNTSSDVDATTWVNIIPAVDLGQLPANGTVSAPAIAMPAGAKVYYTLDVAAGQVVELEHDNHEAAPLDVRVLDATGQLIEEATGIEARSSAEFSRFDVPWSYAPMAMTVLVEVEAGTGRTGETLTFTGATPTVDATLDAGDPFSISNNASIARGHAGYHLLDANEAMALGGTLSPLGGEDVNFRVHELDGTYIGGEFGSGGDVSFTIGLDAAGTYLLRVECDEACAGYNITGDAIRTREDLGTIDNTTASTTPLATFSRNQLYTVSFSVPAGQMIEISHDNDQSEDHEMELLDSNGNVLDASYVFYAASDTDPTYVYWYSDTAADYEVVLEGWTNGTTNEVVTVRTFVPGDLGTIALDTSVSQTGLPGLDNGELSAQTFTLSQDGEVTVDVTTPNGEDVDLVIYDSSFTELAWSGSSPLGPATLSAGTYLVGVEANETVPSFDIDVSVQAPPPPPQYVSSPALAIPDGDPAGVSDTLTVSGCTTVSSVEVYVDISHGYRGDLSMSLVAPDGTSVLLHDETGGSDDDILGWYPTQLTPAGNLANFSGLTGDGDWSLQVADVGLYVSGTLNEWGLTFTCQ